MVTRGWPRTLGISADIGTDPDPPKGSVNRAVSLVLALRLVRSAVFRRAATGACSTVASRAHQNRVVVGLRRLQQLVGTQLLEQRHRIDALSAERGFVNLDDDTPAAGQRSRCR